MTAEIITIGDELLIGMTIDTNSAWMGQFLTMQGFDVRKVSTISDKREDILKALKEATERSELVLVTGGLGPTSDDITKETIAEFYKSPLIENKEAYKSVQALLSARGLDMNDNNRRQAMVPEACTVLKNGKGTAPGMLFESDGCVLVAMPGVPYEMKDIMDKQLKPYLNNNFNRGHIIFRLVMVYGTFEARLAEILEPFESSLPSNVSLAYLPTSGIIKLRLTARGEVKADLEKQLNIEVEKLDSLIPEYIYAYDGEQLEATIGKHLLEGKYTLSLAESCTGGNISHMLTSVPGSSRYLIGSVVAYSNAVKTNILGVKEEDIEREGAVSETVVRAMAEGVRNKLGSNFALATTGVAGPDGGTVEKPVGTVWIAVASKSGTKAEKYTFGKIREQNIRRSSLAGMNMLRKAILAEKG